MLKTYVNPKLHSWDLNSWGTIHWVSLSDPGLLGLGRPEKMVENRCDQQGPSGFGIFANLKHYRHC